MCEFRIDEEEKIEDQMSLLFVSRVSRARQVSLLTWSLALLLALLFAFFSEMEGNGGLTCGGWKRNRKGREGH